MLETESEVLRLPTSVLRESVNDFVGRIYSYLLLNYKIYFLIALLIFLIILFFKVRNGSLARRAKKLEPQSTNNWFSWEDFYKWQEDQKNF